MTTTGSGHCETARQTRTYCTYFDSCFLAQGLVMLRSLRQHDPSAGIHVLALDALCARVLGDVFGGTVARITLDTLQAGHPELPALRATRSLWAFYATHKPVLARFLLEKGAPGAPVLFVDADPCFFGDPSPIFTELSAATIGLSRHRFHAGTKHLFSYGIYNAGCIYWRACASARQCVADWEADCVSWCGEDVPG